MRTIALTLLGRPDCHLCEDARSVVDAVVAGLAPSGAGAAVAVEERSILGDPALLDRYAEEIPVLLLDGRVHDILRVDPRRLRSALEGLGARFESTEETP